MLFCWFSSSPFIVCFCLSPSSCLSRLPASPRASQLSSSPPCHDAAAVRRGPSICQRQVLPTSSTSLPLLAVIWRLAQGLGTAACPAPGSGPAPPRQPPWRTAWYRAQDVTTCKGHTYTPKKTERSTSGTDIGQICKCPSRLSSLSQ